MAQTYYSQPPLSSPSVKQTAFRDGVERPLRVDDIQETYIEHKDRLVHAIDATKDILTGLRKFNKEEWVVRYPRLQEAQSPSAPGLTHSLSFVDQPAVETQVSFKREGLTRSATLNSVQAQATIPDKADTTEEQNQQDRLLPPAEFQILRLDLKLGSHSSADSASALVSQLEKSSIANLLDDRIAGSVSHIDKLRLRVEDTSSKVLVTGDLNAGKSTFVNALLRREIMPVDQQPCTTAFCEVHDAAENNAVEEIHVVKENASYNIKDDSTFTRFPLSQLESVVGDDEISAQPLIKLYLGDTRAPSESLLNNGVVDISLIDAPGLNRDSLKTTALFARQEEIDVVVFVVSAENHFTLSAKEFLWNASNEKAYLFIVVNKYDQIKNKDKCRRLVLEQIKQLSPRTYENADELVHFVDSAAALEPYTANPAFDDLESSLRSFVLVKRSKSKLHPASTYLSNLLGDVDLLAGANSIVAQKELEEAQISLSHARPILEKMQKGREVLEDSLESVEEEGASSAASAARVRLTEALDRVGQGKMPLSVPGVSFPPYPGLLGIWDWARDLRRSFLDALDATVRAAEDDSRVITTKGVDSIKDLAEAHLPEGIERSRRVFMPEAMFSTARARGSKGSKSRRASGQYGSQQAIVAGGYAGLGIGLSQRPEMLETTLFDLVDINHLFWIHFGEEGSDAVSGKEVALSPASPSALSLLSVGLGALTMVGGQGLSARGMVEGVLRLFDMVGNEKTRKYVAPIIGAVTIGMGVYLVLELPKSVPRNVGRRVRYQVLHPSSDVEEVAGNEWTQGHMKRIERETRKVLRLASWDLRERFRGAMEQSTKEVKNGEESEKRAQRAIEWFEGVRTRTETVRDDIRVV